MTCRRSPSQEAAGPKTSSRLSSPIPLHSLQCSQPFLGLSSEVGTLALSFREGQSPRRPQHLTHLGEGFEGPTLGHRLSRLLGSLGCFLHTLLDFPAKVTFTDFVKTLLRQKRERVSAQYPWRPTGAPLEPRPVLNLQRVGGNRHSELIWLLRHQDLGTHI